MAPEMPSAAALDNVPEKIDFVKEEETWLEYWNKIDAFQTSLKKSEGRPEYVFYDGPPFATGLPHYGHILAGTIKDVVTRYAHQTGHHVSRRFGWDCHGLPIEFEIEQQLHISTREQVLAMGIDKYNAECRNIVMRYSQEWETTVSRMGRWIDFKNDYKTMDLTFMETVWWVFKQLFDKDLVYRGYKVMPYSMACTTPLSNFEANLNYKDVNDPAVVVNFPIVDDAELEGTAFLAWTTTPWTLPSNLGLCVHPDLVYLHIEDSENKKRYIIQENRTEELYSKKKKDAFKVLKSYKGAELAGKKYTPLFDYFYERKKNVAFRVVTDTYVTSDSGTGIVHQAPAFGEDDFRVCMNHGIIEKGEIVPCPLDDNGRFTDEVPDFVGKNVKDADKDIVAKLKETGRLVKSGTIIHSYPHCWRSETPLIYKAVPSWFVRVEQIKDRLVANNKEAHWVPAFVQEKRFNNWLENARDWAISRNRYWGTPLPIWASDDFEEIIVVGSVAELEELSGLKNITDLHREHVDKITIPSKKGKGQLKRIEEVFDCWFESGSMPYAQVHYPFENKEMFERTFPADFIAEGLDQTRGWFYTLLVLGTALFDKCPFKNNIVNGLVLAADGKKMSKRLKNYPPPTQVIDAYGADALRLYLINSPVVRAEPLRFKEEGVRDVVKDIFLPWYNAYRFFVQNAKRVEPETGKPFVLSTTKSTNILDKWIEASCQGLIQYVRDEMAAYRLYSVAPRLLRFIEDLTNWYVRLNRARLKGSHGDEDRSIALTTMYNVLSTLNALMAPFTPFLTESSYQNLKKLLPESQREDSVHYLFVPDVDQSKLDAKIEASVQNMQAVIEVGRLVRDRQNISLKTPLKELVVVHPKQGVLDDLKVLESYITEELNVRTVRFSTDEAAYASIELEPDNRALGARLGKKLKEVKDAILKLSAAQIREFNDAGFVDVLGEKITKEELKIIRKPKVNAESALSGDARDDFLVLLDVRPDEDLLLDGVAREVINRVQKLRKHAGLDIQDEIDIWYTLNVDNKAQQLGAVFSSRQDLMAKPLRVDALVPLANMPATSVVIAREDAEIVDGKVEIVLTRRSLHFNDAKLQAKFPAIANLVKVYALSLDRATALALAQKNNGKLPFNIDGIRGEVVLGEEVLTSPASL